jgi:UDP-4-amino-4,6-dideoxy-N-acetyl-beta-L-altrosamine N-acetyltransferase
MSRVVEDKTCRYWVIELEGQPVGVANISGISLKDQRCSWAFYLGDPVTRGKGVGSWVEAEIIRIVFSELGLNKLCCEVLSSNASVVKMHESFGFVVEGRLRQHVWKDGESHDVIVMGLLRADWFAS